MQAPSSVRRRPSVRRSSSPSVRRLSTTLFEHVLRNRWANQSQILYGASMGRGNESLLGGGCGSHDQNGLQSMQHRGLRPNKVCSNHDLRDTLTFLRQGQICFLMLSYGKYTFLRENVTCRKSFNGRNLQ